MKRLILLTILCVSISGCGGKQVDYRPLVLGHDYKNLELVLPKKQGRIYCGDEAFNNYASVSLEDLAILADLIKNARVPWYWTPMKKKMLKQLKEDLELLSQ